MTGDFGFWFLVSGFWFEVYSLQFTVYRLPLAKSRWNTPSYNF